ncbi:MAG: class II aldolase/adducin family protein [Chloroflexi bacterium]|nr:class II aldolase/adducin family protein [Chloroflexota bacterium]
MAIPPAVLREMQEVGRDLYRLALVTSHGGNLSVRDGHGMWITGTGTMLGHLEARHISFVHANGSHEGPPPSSDTVLHSTVYALGGVDSVVHAHPRHAIALSFDTDLFVPPDFEGQLHLQDVPVVPLGPTQVEQITMALQSRRVVLLRGHGAYAKGQTPWEALHWVTALEESAHIAWLRGAGRQA